MGENSPFYFSFYGAILMNVTTVLTRTYIIRVQNLTLYVRSKKSHFCQNYVITQGTGYYTSTNSLGIHIPREKVKGLYNCLCSELWVSHSSAAEHDSLLGCDIVSLGEWLCFHLQGLRSSRGGASAEGAAHCFSLNCFETLWVEGPTVLKTSGATHIQEDMNPHKWV
jgi:hypothetical protein